MGDTTRYITIQGNYIGTDYTGTSAVPNGVGVATGQVVSTNASAGYATIGGTVAGSRNVISGNTGDGVQLNGTSSNSPDHPSVAAALINSPALELDIYGTVSSPRRL
jgi:hypothetical protein